MNQTSNLSDNEQGYLTRGKKTSDVPLDTTPYAENEGVIPTPFMDAGDDGGTLDRLDEVLNSAGGEVISEDDPDDNDPDDPDQA